MLITPVEIVCDTCLSECCYIEWFDDSKWIECTQCGRKFNLDGSPKPPLPQWAKDLIVENKEPFYERMKRRGRDV